MKEIDGLTTQEERAAEIFRALGNPARIRIVTELAKRNACVPGEVFQLLPLAQSTISQHLKVLKEAGVVKTSDDDGCYCLEADTVQWLVAFCNEVCCPDGVPLLNLDCAPGADCC
jgi:ArsR family transcriptional regulator